jgi:hypothetical protein
MALSSSLDVVLDSNDITVFAPPSSIDVIIDIGPQGDRGSRMFTGTVDPTTYTTDQFKTAFGYAPVFGDVYIRTDTGSNYGTFYMYTSAPGVALEWKSIVKITDLVVAQASALNPLALGTSASGSSIKYSREDHVHPTTGIGLTANTLAQFASTTSSQLAGVISDETGTGSLVFATSPTLDGTPTSASAAVDTNTSQIATTAFVIGQASSVNPPKLGSVAIGTSTRYARADHVHPTTDLGLIAGKLSQFSSTTSAELYSIISDATGNTANSGGLVFSNNPTLYSPIITGTPTLPAFNISGNNIKLNSNETGSPSMDASISVERGTSPDVSIQWNETNDTWEFTNDGTTYKSIGSGGTTNIEDVIGIGFFTMGA